MMLDAGDVNVVGDDDDDDAGAGANTCLSRWWNTDNVRYGLVLVCLCL